MRKTIQEVLMKRDGMTEEAAEELIQEARWQMETYLEMGDISAAEDICEEYFGLEPDYLDELL